MFRGHATGGPRGTASLFRAAIGISLSRLEVLLSEHKRGNRINRWATLPVTLSELKPLTKGEVGKGRDTPDRIRHSWRGGEPANAYLPRTPLSTENLGPYLYRVQLKSTFEAYITFVCDKHMSGNQGRQQCTCPIFAFNRVRTS